MNDLKNKKQKGIALTEIVIVTGIFAILFGIATTNLFTSRNKASINTSTTSFISSFQEQQAKAMALDTEGREEADSYGIYFEQNRYILFHGSLYSAADVSNFSIDLEEGLTFSSISLPSSSVVFQKRSGEVVGFDSDLSSFTIKNSSTNDEKTFRINRFGTIKEIN